MLLFRLVVACGGALSRGGMTLMVTSPLGRGARISFGIANGMGRTH